MWCFLAEELAKSNIKAKPRHEVKLFPYNVAILNLVVGYDDVTELLGSGETSDD